uniref:Medium-chain acyl-CoA ligase ACSF2, mitochondrial n=1 Tax=Gasterosteus aculeatus aculeatus TaxID=481459 RepID=A0AAQ4P1H7_GASAC
MSNSALKRFLESRKECEDGIHVDSSPITSTLTTSYAHGTSSSSLLNATVGESLLRTVERWPDREAVIFVKDRVRKTFAQLQQDVSVNPAYKVQEAEFALRKSGCKAVVCPSQFNTQDYSGMLTQLCPGIEASAPGDVRSGRLPDLRCVILLDRRQPGMLCFEDVMQAGSSQHMEQLQDLQKKISTDDPINIQFTSGTTGTPKGATLSHHNIVNNAYFVGKRPFNRICLPVPLYHCFGSVGGGMCMAVHGVTAVFPSAGYNGKANLAALESERCTFLYGTPTMFVDMVNQPDLAKYDLSSVHGGIMGGSPAPPELVKKVISVMGIKGLIVAYGTTENSPVTFCPSPKDSVERKSETVGYIMDHVEAKIVDPTSGQVVPLGATGELMTRGYCVMLGYWDDEAKTRESITRSGWYKTGDLATMDAYSYCRIEGRIKDMIIRGGENIYPAEIEQFLHTHPKVKEAQVVGVQDARMGEEICACIRLSDGEECTEEEIKAYCKEHISHFKIPRYVLFVTSYPLTATAKIQKDKLREEAEQQLGLKNDK